MENQIWYDVSGTPTKLTDIKYGSFHYHADIGTSGKARLGGVCSSYIEFDYLLSNGVTFNVGDVLRYKQLFPEIDNAFEPAATDLVWDGGNFYIKSVDDDGKTCHIIAFDTVSKLDIDYSARLQATESTYPHSLSWLMNDVCTFAGVTYDLAIMGDLSGYSVNYFYASGISCRDVVRAIAELCCYYVRATENDNEIKFTYGGGFANAPWQNSYRYIIVPDDGTYRDTNNNIAINVWYKENGMNLAEQITKYDGTIIYDVNGTPYGDTTATNPYKFYSANSLFSSSLKARQATIYHFVSLAVSKIFYVNGFVTSGKIKLFPFRFPYKVGQFARILTPDGGKPYFPIMSLDLSESEVVIESYSDKTVGAEAQNGVGSGGEDRSLALDVRVTALESQKIDGYTLVNFASASAGTISTYNSRSFSDYIWLVAEWVVNSSIRATMMFRRVDFENAPYVSLFYVDSANTQRWCELSYVDDTTLSITASSNASGNIALFGLAIVSGVSSNNVASVEYLTTADGDYLTTVDGDYLTL